MSMTKTRTEPQEEFDRKVMACVARYARCGLRLSSSRRTTYATVALIDNLDDSVCWMEVVGDDGLPLFEQHPEPDDLLCSF